MKSICCQLLLASSWQAGLCSALADTHRAPEVVHCPPQTICWSFCGLHNSLLGTFGSWPPPPAPLLLLCKACLMLAVERCQHWVSIKGRRLQLALPLSPRTFGILHGDGGESQRTSNTHWCHNCHIVKVCHGARLHTLGEKRRTTQKEKSQSQGIMRPFRCSLGSGVLLVGWIKPQSTVGLKRPRCLRRRQTRQRPAPTS